MQCMVNVFAYSVSAQALLTSSCFLNVNAACIILYKQTIQNKLLEILNVSHFSVNNESRMRNTNELE